MDKSNKQLGETFLKPDSELENTQEIVLVVFGADNSEDENDNIQTRIGAPPKNSKFSIPMRETLASLMKSRNFVKMEQGYSGPAITLGAPIIALGGNKIKTKDIVCILSPELYKVLFPTGYASKSTKKDNDVLMLNNIIKVTGYTRIGDRDSARKTFFTVGLPKMVAKIEPKMD